MSDKKRWMAKGATGCSVLALALTGAITFPSAPAFAQAASSGVQGPVYYKNKGPGGTNSYAFRYEEDFSFLRDQSKSTDFFDPMKFIAFDDAKQFYVAVPGLEGLRYDSSQNNAFDLGSHVKGDEEEAFSRRTQVGAEVLL